MPARSLVTPALTNQLKVGGPQDLLLRLHNLLVNSSQNSGRYSIYLYWFLIKNTKEQPDDEVGKATFGRVLDTSVPVGLGCTSFLAPARKLLWISLLQSFCRVQSAALGHPGLPRDEWERVSFPSNNLVCLLISPNLSLLVVLSEVTSLEQTQM